VTGLGSSILVHTPASSASNRNSITKVRLADANAAIIDNCAWDVFFAAGVDLSQEFPRELFTLWITREAEFEIPPIKRLGLKDYIAS